MIFFLIFAAGCNTTQPAASPVPPTGTTARATNTMIAPTATPPVIQPSATSMPPSTDTPLEPTTTAAATPTAMAAATAAATAVPTLLLAMEKSPQQAVEQEKVLAAICNAPLELGFAGILEGRTVTGEPSQTCRRLVSEFGADCTGDPVERDGLIITTRDRFASLDFAETIIEILDEKSAAKAGDDRGLIAFVSTRDGDGEIYKMDADGSNLRQLTENTIWDGFPTWSPDGKRIAYSSDDGCTGEHREIYVMDADGGSPRNLTHNDADDMSSSWSPDSQQIVFSSNRDGDYEIYIMNDDGSNVNQLTDNEVEDLMPAWSPDGAQIAFVTDRDGNDEIYVMGIDGKGVKRLTYDSPNDWFPFWSSDGMQLLYNSWRDGNLEIYVMDAIGGNVQRLTDTPKEDFNAVWQP